MIIEGLKFGMLLQLAIGPMCLMVFETAGSSGILSAFILVSAIALVDAFYIILAGAGVSAIVDNQAFKLIFKIVGSMVLAVFGVNIILEVFGLSILPSINLFGGYNGTNIFIKGLVLTASNPLTIVFWGSVLSTKAADSGISKKDLVVFGTGCVLATILFLGSVAILGGVISSFLPNVILSVLNVVVGVFIIFFSIRMLLKK